MIDDVLRFWFEEATPAQWWKKDPAFDAAIAARFSAVHAAAARCECHGWRATPEGRLAEILVLDQFSRNLFRDRAAAFATDPLSLALAQEMVAGGLDDRLTIDQRRFVYMPYMHSESLAIHDIAVVLFDQPGLEDNLKFEHLHRDIIARFGRYPHRNALLGRTSTPEEAAFLLQPGSSF
jgi:uncharacterized protein (DUF924 family)